MVGMEKGKRIGSSLVILMIGMVLIITSCSSGMTSEEKRILQLEEYLNQKDQRIIDLSKETSELRKQLDAKVCPITDNQLQVIQKENTDLVQENTLLKGNITKYKEDLVSLDRYAETIRVQYYALLANYTAMPKPNALCITNLTFYCPEIQYLDCIPPIPTKNRYLCSGTYAQWLNASCPDTEIFTQ